MTDITTTWAGARGDWALKGSQLRADSDLHTAVLISLFTDRVVPSNDLITDGTADPRGWWADDAEYPIGSRLWTLYRSKLTADTLAAARDYIAEALQWLIDDDVVASFDIECEWRQPSQLSAQITAYRNDGNTEAMQFAWAWNGST